MTQKELIHQEIERRKGYTSATHLAEELESLPEETSCVYDTNEFTPTHSVNIEDVARVQFASHAHVFDRKRKAVFDWEQFKEVAGIFYGFGKRDSLLEDDIPKIEGWIARNKDGSLVFCYHKPHRENSITQEWWGSCDADFRIYDDTIDEQFKDLKWEDEPREVELIIKCGTCKDSLQVQETCKENQDSFTDKPKDLEEELDNYFKGLWPGIETAEQCNTDLHFTPLAIMRLASHFAEWGAKH